jgi:hypothetical protein
MAANHVTGAYAWLNYPNYLLEQSPVLREVVSNHKEWWPTLAALLARLPAEKGDRLDESG